MLEIRNLELVESSGRAHTAVVKCWDTSPDNPDEVLIELAIDDKVVRGTSAKGYFHAFCEIRRQLEPLGLMPCCFATCENVYPSPMIESMGCGEQAYLLSLGRPARTSDLVNIFDRQIEMRLASVEQQHEFYQLWIDSL